MNYSFGWNDALGHQGDDGFESTPGQEGAEEGAADGEEKTFDEELANDAPAASSESGLASPYR